MKISCRVDGVHFPQDFDKTLEPPCNYWGDMGLGNLQVDLKRKFWDWFTAMPTDEIGIRAKINVFVTFSTAPIDEDDKFEKQIPGYNLLTEKDQQALQRELFRRKSRGEDIEAFIKSLNFIKKGKKAE